MTNYGEAFQILSDMGYTYTKTNKFPGFEYRVPNSCLQNDERSESGASEKFTIMAGLRRAGYRATMLGATQAVHFGPKPPVA